MHTAIAKSFALSLEGLFKGLVLTSEYTIIIIAAAMIFILNVICVAGIYKLYIRTSALDRKLIPAALAHPIAAVPPAAGRQAISDSELVAVIAAAITAMNSDSGSAAPYPGFKVRSIRKIEH
ncbi:MAG: hypothetical protein ACYC5K_06535 [Saccharofermentanales bacterium]